MIIVNSIFPVLYGTSDFIKMQFVSSVRADLLLPDLINPVEMNTYTMLPSEVSSL